MRPPMLCESDVGEMFERRTASRFSTNCTIVGTSINTSEQKEFAYLYSLWFAICKLLISPLLRQNKRTGKPVLLFWRRRRDSNSRTIFGSYAISSRARSTNYATSPYCFQSLLLDNIYIISYKHRFVNSFFEISEFSLDSFLS